MCGVMYVCGGWKKCGMCSMCRVMYKMCVVCGMEVCGGCKMCGLCSVVDRVCVSCVVYRKYVYTSGV